MRPAPRRPSPDAAPTFAEVIRDLDRIRAGCRKNGDRNGYFAAMYGRVTAAVEQRAQAGRFDDPARMEAFVARFARRYTDAYRAHLIGRPVTRSWALAFDTAARSDPLVVQHLALGMNAHINLDLGVVAAELASLAPEDEAPSPSADTLHEDFVAINDVLAELVDRCQAAVVAASPLLALADDVLDTHDENAAKFSLVVARSGAWRFSQQLAAAPQAAWPGLIEERDAGVERLGQRLLTRAGTAHTVQRLIRLGEWRAVEEVIDLLAAVDVT